MNKYIQDEDELSMRFPGGSERAEITTAGARMTDIEGMSQMTFHTQTQFGREGDEGHRMNDDATSKNSDPQTVYTKPFTVQSGKNSNMSKM